MNRQRRRNLSSAHGFFARPNTIGLTFFSSGTFFEVKMTLQNIYTIENHTYNPSLRYLSQGWNSLLPEPRRRKFAIAGALLVRKYDKNRYKCTFAPSRTLKSHLLRYPHA